MLIDPPTGWLYGFPKRVDLDTITDLRQWLIDNGYPEEDVDFGMKYCRYIATLEEAEKYMERRKTLHNEPSNS